MKAYNIYYKETKLNKLPVSREDAERLINEGEVIRMVDNKPQRIPTKELKIVRCTII